MIRDAHVVHTYAEYAMVRAAIECAALAWWLVAPEERQVRVERHLRLMWRDTVDLHDALGDLQEIDDRRQKRRREIEEAADAAGIRRSSVFGRWGYNGIVDEFSQATMIPALLTWQAASGMIHGRRWAMGALSNLSPGVETGVREQLHVKVSGDIRQLGMVLRVARLSLTAAERLYAGRRIAPGNYAASSPGHRAHPLCVSRSLAFPSPGRDNYPHRLQQLGAEPLRHERAVGLDDVGDLRPPRPVALVPGDDDPGVREPVGTGDPAVPSSGRRRRQSVLDASPRPASHPQYAASSNECSIGPGSLFGA